MGDHCDVPHDSPLNPPRNFLVVDPIILVSFLLEASRQRCSWVKNKRAPLGKAVSIEFRGDGDGGGVVADGLLLVDAVDGTVMTRSAAFIPEKFVQ
jgi:hypothetical protein